MDSLRGIPIILHMWILTLHVLMSPLWDFILTLPLVMSIWMIVSLILLFIRVGYVFLLPLHNLILMLWVISQLPPNCGLSKWDVDVSLSFIYCLAWYLGYNCFSFSFYIVFMVCALFGYVSSNLLLAFAKGLMMILSIIFLNTLFIFEFYR